MHRRQILKAGAATLAGSLFPLRAVLAAETVDPVQVLDNWYRLTLELVRHTPTYSPPVASRAFAYIGVTAWEAVASLTPGTSSLAGQLNDLAALPAAPEGARDAAALLHGALSPVVMQLFANTGPTGHRALDAMNRAIGKKLAALEPAVLDRSMAHGQAIAAHILAWAATDGGAVIENMGFPLTYALAKGPSHWVPTGATAQQQLPLLPAWGGNRAFAMATGNACPLPAPFDYSEDPASPFHAEAKEVYDVTRSLTEEQQLIARYWSDDPMLTSTPPGHWISILLQIAERDALPLERRADALARLGVTLADAFIGCWHTKFEFDLLRPVTYIRRVIDPKWEPLLNTPPFPEYPSGHSTQSGAAATVLTALFGDGFAFTDATHVDDGLPERSFPDFHAAAQEAAISRLYGGIHFRAAIERGVEQGVCIGAHAVALKTLA